MTIYFCKQKNTASGLFLEHFLRNFLVLTDIYQVKAQERLDVIRTRVVWEKGVFKESFLAIANFKSYRMVLSKEPTHVFHIDEIFASTAPKLNMHRYEIDKSRLPFYFLIKFRLFRQ